MYDVITIGTATRDIFLQSALFRVLRDPAHLKKIGFPAGEAQCFALGGKVEIENMAVASGGGATNAAATFSRQGLKTAAVLKVGADEAGKNIIEELKKEKIRPFASLDKKVGTAYGIILLSSLGERTILVYRGASENLKKNEVPLSKLRARWAYLAPGNISFDVMRGIVHALFENGVNIAVNPSKKLIEKKMAGLKDILSKSRVVILNREEGSYLTGIDYKNEKGIFKKLDRAISGIAVMTDGKNGVLVSDGHRIYRAGVFEEKRLVDRTGAGDAFGSGLVAGLIHRDEECQKGLCRPENIEYAIRLGSANSTSVIESVGAKTGILTKRAFNGPRWKKLPVQTSRLL